MRNLVAVVGIALLAGCGSQLVEFELDGGKPAATCPGCTDSGTDDAEADSGSDVDSGGGSSTGGSTTGGNSGDGSTADLCGYCRAVCGTP
jgi:hypothetical protein